VVAEGVAAGPVVAAAPVQVCDVRRMRAASNPGGFSDPAGVAVGTADGAAGGDGVEPQRRGDLGDGDADLPAGLAVLG
jgi:hypothetical protein